MNMETEHFICTGKDRDLLRPFADTLERRLVSVIKDFGLSEPVLKDRIRFHLCEDVEEYIAAAHKTRETYQSWMVGNSDFLSRRICLLSPGADRELFGERERVAVHELVHMVLDDITGSPENEAWLSEGIAILYAGQTDLRYVSDADHPAVSALSEICRNGETPDSFADNGGYGYAGIYVWYFLKKYGTDIFMQAYQNKICAADRIYPGFEAEAISAYRKEQNHE